MMDLGISERVAPLLKKVKSFIENNVIPVQKEFLGEIERGDRWSFTDRQTEIL